MALGGLATIWKSAIDATQASPCPAPALTTAARHPGAIRVNGISVDFHPGTPRALRAIDDITLAIDAGSFVAVLGPSGCGKSTLLNAIAGFLRPTQGEILLDGRPIVAPGADRGVVFQQPTLFPWKTVLQNIALGPRTRGLSRQNAEAVAARFMTMVGLTDFADSYPESLSGGMQQRVGIARALANEPTVLLMDEPFGALDAQTREIMQKGLLGVWENLRTTLVFVTHDIDEAILLADRIIVMSARPGRILAEIDVPIPRPRRDGDILGPAFLAIKKRCRETIRSESERAFLQVNQARDPS